MKTKYVFSDQSLSPSSLSSFSSPPPQPSAVLTGSSGAQLSRTPQFPVQYLLQHPHCKHTSRPREVTLNSGCKKSGCHGSINGCCGIEGDPVCVHALYYCVSSWQESSLLEASSLPSLDCHSPSSVTPPHLSTSRLSLVASPVRYTHMHTCTCAHPR